MRSMSLESFIDSLNLTASINTSETIGKFFDISDRELYTDSYNVEKQRFEKKLIVGIIYQGKKQVFELRTYAGDILLKCSNNHKPFDPIIQDYVEIDKVESLHVLTVTGDIIEAFVVPTENFEDVYDLTVEDNANYFSNGILSKNCTGGFAVNYYASTRFRVSCKEFITKNGEIVGIKMKVKNYKNKTGTPFRECLLDLYFKDGPDYKAGIDGEGQYLDMLIDLGLISQRGAWYYYRENDPDENKRQKFQGWNGVQQWFKDNPDEFEQVKKLVDEKMSQFNERLDKNTLELNEADEIKNEIEDAQKRKAENAEKLQQIEQTDQLGQVE